MIYSMNTYKKHPWHGVNRGSTCPQVVKAFIEILPSDTVKYEIDKDSGYLKIDRPQKFSNVVPALYGFIPQTYCAENVASFCKANNVIKGDGDPLDILVLCSREIYRSDILVDAIPIGGLRLVDKNEADDKIIAVMKDDEIYSQYTELHQLPNTVLNKLKHYFLTYKNLPDDESKSCYIEAVYGKTESYQVIEASVLDYNTLISTL